MTAPSGPGARPADRVRMRAGYLWLLRLACPLVGLVLGLTVKPLVQWAVQTLESAPAPLRLAAAMPTPWAVPILVVLGAVAGYWLSREAERDCLTLVVRPDALVAAYGDTERHIQRSQVSAVYTDPPDVVVRNAEGREVLRAPAADMPKQRLADALCRHHYPWRGTRDPHEDDYRWWTDGDPDLDERDHALLRARQAALQSRSRGEAEQIRSQLQENGIVVRDREKRQQYRRLTGWNTPSAH